MENIVGKEKFKKLQPYEQSKDATSTFSYTPSTFSYTPAVRPREQQSWQERIKKDQKMEKQDKELKRLQNKVHERRKKASKEYYGYGIVPPIYPSKMLVNLVKLLA